jgi:PAS domain S-box-containing protein
VNDRWCAIAGITIDRAIGDGWRQAIHPEDAPHVIDRWNRLRLQEELFREEYRICRPDGSMRWVLAEGVPLRSYRGRLLGFIRTVTDITRHRELEQQVNAARVLETKENEQRRFSEDLHDGLGQYLTGILFRASALQRDLEAEHSQHAAAAAKIAELVNETISQTHDLARGIHPVSLRPDGLMLALQELQQKLCDPQIANCVFECEEPVYLDDPARATHVYRIAQEAVTNAVKYSRASTITMTLRNSADCAAELIVRDDGRGFDAKATRANGSGLGIMKHRARLIDAELEIQSNASGTTLACRFPLSPNES